MRIWILVGLVVFGAHVVFADEHHAVLNDPSATVNLVKDVINKLNPSYETLWDLSNGRFSQGVSANLYTFTSHDIPLGGVRAGWSTGDTLYSGVSLDLPGLTRRYVPDVLKGVATAGALRTLWNLAGKYARVGVVGGYSWAEADAVYGFTAGAALTF